MGINQRFLKTREEADEFIRKIREDHPDEPNGTMTFLDLGELTREELRELVNNLD
ncbi:MAG: hypothetical protein WAV55_06600 [Clostridiaceae bacterium]